MDTSFERVKILLDPLLRNKLDFLRAKASPYGPTKKCSLLSSELYINHQSKISAVESLLDATEKPHWQHLISDRK